ncbi:MAG TPA: tRNA (adenosine(37)-N6)-threonylcarbamoyltransferase complex dimerization subunit type 1 TsaB [Candidatus Levybacteria bacterium]|nr:tRNA (adenosine(37)-N6)-threonylcarbamoyltransferase complex dimerization subunit type 1 TsaB [Candidatus Levybacteria bacterium]
MNILCIDTRDNKKNIVKLTKNDQEFVAETDIATQADGILILIQNLLKQADLKVQDIDKIYCEKGPGSFTGLRVGFAIANTLSLALLIPLNDNKLGTIDTPVYS